MTDTGANIADGFKDPDMRQQDGSHTKGGGHGPDKGPGDDPECKDNTSGTSIAHRRPGNAERCRSRAGRGDDACTQHKRLVQFIHNGHP